MSEAWEEFIERFKRGEEEPEDDVELLLGERVSGVEIC